MAGESARAVARRQREKAERLARSATLWERGAEGEEAVASALAQLPAATWTVFHDVRWPGRRYANVDHIVVGPPGVFVIDSKNWSGQIAVKDGVLRQGGRSREASVASASEAGQAVATLVPVLEPHLVHPVLCFVTDDEFAGWARNVMVCSTTNLVTMLTSRPAVLAGHQVEQLCLALDLGLRDAEEPAPPVMSAASGPRRRNSTPARVSARRKNTSTSRRRDRSGSGLAGFAAGVVFLGVLVLRPDVLTGLADDVTALFFEQTTSDTSEPKPNQEQRKKPADRRRGATQGR